MPASFPTSAKSFTTKNTSDTIQAAHINDLQAEVTAIENCLLGTTVLNAVIGGTLAVTGAVTLTAGLISNDTTDSTSTLTGAFQTDGGLGVAKALWVGGLANIAGAATLQSTLDVTGIATFTADVKTTAWTDYTATSTIVGWSSFTSGRKFIMYKKIGKLMLVAFHLEGTSNSATTSFTLPVAAVTVGTAFDFSTNLGFAQDNTVTLTAASRLRLPNASSTVECFKDCGTTGWTTSGTKIVEGLFWYEAAS